MFYHLLVPLTEYLHAFNVFRYITFRASMATLTALLVSLVLGPRLIRRLQQFEVGQEIREEGPSSHHTKKGTPTMGGLLIVTAVVLPTVLWADLRKPYIWIAVASMFLFGAIGFLDDWLKVARKQSLGFTARRKFLLQVLVGAGFGVLLLWMETHGLYDTGLTLPFIKGVSPNLGWGYILFTILVLTGSANAVNLTDGLDGLAIGASLMVAATFTVIAYAAGHALVADYLGIPNVKEAGELTIFCGSMVGACLGFLWFNSHPAEVFMGDTGSMALGGSLGAVALLVKQEFLLVIAGGLFVVEAMSVILQVGSFKLRKRRIFKMSPLHHHFELAGWSETKVVIRFWIISIIFGLLALATLKLR
jgi:phospho-N-acetylmuramoyl-pentapeptide-transferase